MKLSFIAPRKKHYLKIFTKIWLSFILIITIMLNAFNMFVIYKNRDYQTTAKELDITRAIFEQSIDDTDKQISFVLRQKTAAEEIYANNIILKDSIKNLFDLVPDQITLKKVTMEKDSLVIYGETPTKDMYNFLLAAPLRSIFHTSNTMFYLTKKGWYNFISTNKTKNLESIE
ncbi:MAG: hypothetical protein JJV95_05325 [Sulfurospirillum sp.]|nr:hypothetical protein [Sulfurospirillum sp.]MBL0703386.1 hypothetical protein [Sulfurospirillum sp.]